MRACLLLIALSIPAYAQTRHYFVGNRRVQLTEVSPEAFRALLIQETGENGRKIVEKLERSAEILSGIGRLSESLAFVENTRRLGKLADRNLALSQVKQLRVFLTSEAGLHMLELPEVIVQFREQATLSYIQRLFSRFDVRAIQDGRPGRYLVRLRPNEPDQIMKFANLIQADKANVLFAEPNFEFVRPLGGSPPTRPVWPTGATLPNGAPKDRGFALQWSLWNPGTLVGSKKGADIRMLPVFQRPVPVPPSRVIKVAILDFAVDSRHPDLSQNLTPGINAFAENPNAAVEIGKGNENEADHGTAVAGILGAVRDADGLAGIASGFKMIPIQFAGFNDNGTRAALSSQAISRAFARATAAGADMAVMSWGWTLLPAEIIVSDVNEAIRAFSKPVFLAAGNDHTFHTMTDLDYPASQYQILPNIIAVGASTFCDSIKETVGCDGEKGWRSRRPKSGPFLLAPGVSILTTSTLKNPSNPSDPVNYRTNFGGTSAAAPIAAAVAVLIMQAKPDIKLPQLRQLLLDTADKVSDTSDFRRLNACRALGLGGALCAP